MSTFPGLSQLNDLYDAAKSGATSAVEGFNSIPSVVEGGAKSLGNQANEIVEGAGSALTQSTPSDTSSSSDPATKPSGIMAQERALEGNYPTAAASVANTPDAATRQETNDQENAQREAALAGVLNPYNKTSNKTGSKGAQPPTEQQDVNQALAPDQALLDQLPDVYKQAIASIQPYISGGTDTGNAALNSADEAVANEIGTSDSKVMAALKGLSKAGTEFEGTVPYSGIIQALLGFGKYEETYEGAQPQGQASWTISMDEIYKYLSGSSASTDGLGSPTVAATQASQNQTTGDGSGGGNAS